MILVEPPATPLLLYYNTFDRATHSPFAYQPGSLMRTMMLTLASIVFSVKAHAQSPSVVTDVAPIHSLVAQVMQGVGKPVLLIPAKVSPHGHALKVSQMRALTQADIVFWVGEALTPWLEKALDRLPEDAEAVELLDVDGLNLLTYDTDEKEGDDHDEHDDHHHGHDHAGLDPHIWLDPANAKVLIDAIANTLAQRDEANAERYKTNAKTAKDTLEKLLTDTHSATKIIKDKRYIVYHDGYRYFEAQFGLGRAVAIADGHAAKPGAKRLIAIRKTVAELSPHCIFSESQFETRPVQSLLRGTDAVEAQLDPMGQSIEPGPRLYETLIRNLTNTFTRCLK